MEKPGVVRAGGSTNRKRSGAPEDPKWSLKAMGSGPQVSRAAPGIAGSIYFRVYGKRLEPAHTDSTPHPLRKWRGEQQGCG